MEIDSAAAILDSIHKDLDQRDASAKAIEADMRRRNDELDRKASEMELLNRRYNAIMSAQGPAQHTGE